MWRTARRQGWGGGSRPLTEEAFVRISKVSARKHEEGFGRQLDLRDSCKALVEWEEVLADLSGSSIVCAIIGVLLCGCYFGVASGSSQRSLFDVVEIAVFWFCLPFAISCIRLRLVDGEWTILGSVIFFIVLLFLIGDICFYLCILALFWRLKELYDVRSAILSLEEHIANLEREQSMAYE